jgi:hypothetical protein
VAIALVKCIAGVLSGSLRRMYVGPRSLLVAARIDLAHGELDAEGVFLEPRPRPNRR